MGSSLIIFGIVLALVGVLWNVFYKTGIPLLPGDIFIKKDNVTFYFPIVSSILLSIILTIIFNLINRK
jgi:hypothetical protein